MSGNILYFPYTGLMGLGLIILVILFLIKSSRNAAKKAFLIAIPMVILLQFYYWNSEFNNYAKSYVFSSKEYTCDFDGQMNRFSIPLPERTVFKGMEDVCSPFYLTYVRVDDFKAFYEEKLKLLQSKGELQEYHLFEKKYADGVQDIGFEGKLSSGFEITVFYREYEFKDWRSISIKIKKTTHVDHIDPSEGTNPLPTPKANAATYVDYSASLKDMKDSADAIVIGKPVSLFSQKEYGVISNVEVISTLKGKSFETIKIYQIGKADENFRTDGDVLPFNQTYILFLGKQEDDEPNTFYVRAGWQGAFLIDSGGKLWSNDNSMNDELKTLLMVNTDKTEQEALLELIND